MTEREEDKQYNDIVKSLIGEEICSLSNSQYFFNDEKVDEDLGEIEIETVSGLKVCFKLLSDGESVGAYSGDLYVPSSFEVNDGEQASWKKIPIEQEFNVTGSKIVAIDTMYDKYLKFNSEVLAGWRVKLANQNYFVFYNCGDNAKILFNELPDDAIEGIVTTWQPI
ncbi:hypothetical protein NBRC116188_00820 [Oceaniserpentilla sp. 4NH20-0058]|uniref:hypothetical protein n=1 Tax=Oceaniserpentilla sp. 4NH20-0058 TaxID=3127660 RepID=UPI003109C39E